MPSQNQRITTRDRMFAGILFGVALGAFLGILLGALGSIAFLIPHELELITLPSSKAAAFFTICGLWAANIVACPIAGSIAGLLLGLPIGGALVAYEKIQAVCRTRNTLNSDLESGASPNENTALIQAQPTEETPSLPSNHRSPVAWLTSCFSNGNTQSTSTKNLQDSLFNNPGADSLPQNHL